MDWIEKNIVDLYKEGKTVCVTTNGYLKRNGEGVMGKGNAACMKETFPSLQLPAALGAHIQRNGNHVGFIGERVIAFPVKPIVGGLVECLENFRAKQEKELQPGQLVPGWMCKADIDLIYQSFEELYELIYDQKLTEVYLPLPGCDNGGLNEDDLDYMCKQKWGMTGLLPGQKEDPIKLVRIFI